MRKSAILLLITAFIAVFICSCSNSGSGSEIINPFENEGDRIVKVGNLEVNESKIFIFYKSGKFFLNIPVKLDKGSDPIAATCSVSTEGLDGMPKEDSEKQQKEQISDKTETLAIDLGADYLPDIEELTNLILKYSIKWNSHNLSGKVSMFRISPKMRTFIIGNKEVVSGGTSIFRIFVSDVLSGEPIASGSPLMNKEITVEFFSGDELVGKVSAKTDKGGMAEIPVSLDDSVTGNITMVATTETVYGKRTLSANLVSATQESYNKTLLTTDKPLYQPGQTIHIRSLSLGLPDKKPMDNTDITFELSDPKGNKVFKKTGKTSRYGIFSADFKLANLVSLGNYQLSALIDGVIAAQKTLTVEKYVLPKFGIEFSADKGFYLPGETMEGEIVSNYFYGKPVSNGIIHIEAKTSDVSETTFQTIDATLSQDGKYTFSIKLPNYFTGSTLEQGNAKVKLEITVTDTADHAQSVVKYLTVAQSPVIATLVPAAGKMLPGTEQTMYLILTDPQGNPVSGKAAIKASGESVEQNVDESGFAEFKMVLPEDGKVTVGIKYDGKTYESVKYFKNDGNAEFIFLSTDSPIYDAGEDVEVSVFTGFDPNAEQPSMLPDRAYLDVVVEDQIRLTKVVELKEGKGKISLPLDETMHGVVEFLAYYLTKEGNIIRSSKAVYVRKASSLSVEFSTDKEEYKPRETAKARFTVKDVEGKPAPAALGVAMVDEAVFHVMDFVPGMEATYFNIESAIMESNFVIYGTSYQDIVSSSKDEELEEETEKRVSAFFADNAGNLQHDIAKEDYSQYESKHNSAARSAVGNKVSGALSDTDWNYCEDINEINEKLKKIFAKSENADPWGNVMNASAKQDHWGTYAVIASAGPDETAETEDDIKIEVTLCEEYWDEDADAEAGNWDGGDTGSEAGYDGDDTGEAGNSGKKIKVREWFPETLYYNPQLITDDSGKAEVEIQMADSITSWRVTALANTLGGAIGSSLDSIRVFQDFFVDIDFPVSLTQNDEISVPVGIYNYLNVEQNITLEAESDDWFEMTGDSAINVTVPANSVTSAYFPIKVLKIGTHSMTIFAHGSQMSDAIKRTVTVKPDGIMEDKSESAVFSGNKTIKLTIPENAIPDSAELFVKIYPGFMSQAVEGLDSILQLPYGCFEQTSSTTYPNVLVLQYMIAADTLTPEIELKARDYITQGYQRLLTYEVQGGGFEWFGDSPAHLTLTAYGLLEFNDMSKVHTIDPNLIDRTAAWIAQQQKSDGSFVTENGYMDGAINNFLASALRTTAYAAWALAETDKELSARQKAVQYIESHLSEADDIYSKAMAAIALIKNGGTATKIEQLVNEILEAKQEDAEGSIYWNQTLSTETYTSGEGAKLETTALVGSLLVYKGGYANITDRILKWIVKQKDSFGNWSTTQGTIRALKFMVESMYASAAPDTNATLKISANGSPETTIKVTPDDSDVMRLIDFKEHLVYGENTIEIKSNSDSNMLYQATATWYVPGSSAVSTGPLTIDVTYDKTNLAVNDTVKAAVTIKNVSEEKVNMVLASVGIAPGFTLIPALLDAAVENGTPLRKYESTPRQIILYLNYIEANSTQTYQFELVADYPIKGATGESSVHPYYNPEENYNDLSQEIVISE
ncbi:hypothetical protein J6Z19_00890 [bacterium]|nr:hypothetical protein [bacterium]